MNALAAGWVDDDAVPPLHLLRSSVSTLAQKPLTPPVTRVAAPDAERGLDAAARRSAEVGPVAFAVFLPTPVGASESDVGEGQELNAAADPNGGPVEGRGRHVLSVRGRSENSGAQGRRRKHAYRMTHQSPRINASWKITAKRLAGRLSIDGARRFWLGVAEKPQIRQSLFLANKPVLLGEFPQGDLGPGADMADHLGRGEAAESPAER